MHLHYARLAEPPGTEPAGKLPHPRLEVSAEEISSVKAKFNLPSRYAVLAPGAEYGPAKRWPYFKELSGRLELPAVVLGSGSDAQAAQDLQGTNLVGRTSLDEAIELIGGAALVVSNDSGLMHVAAALGTAAGGAVRLLEPRAHAAAVGRGARAVAAASNAAPASRANARSGTFAACATWAVESVLREIHRSRCVTGKIFPTAQDAENAFYEALERADLERMMAVWAEDEEIVCVHPGGPRLTGQDQVRESWRQIFAGGGARARAHRAAGRDHRR